MSTLKFDKNDFSSTAPKWTLSISEQLYHADAHAGKFLSSSMLREFRRCPAHYHKIINGDGLGRTAKAFRMGRAAHKLILEGERVFRANFIVGGPWNELTGRPYTHGCGAFAKWVEECGLNPETVITPVEESDLRVMTQSLRRHVEASRLLGEGWAERVARTEVEGVECQARFDWLRGDGVGVELKTTGDISRFEDDARRFGYLHQLAFYRDVARLAGGVELNMAVVVVEKRRPFRVGVWRFEEGVLEPYAVQNRVALRALRRCRAEGRWPTGYEGTRVFPPAGLPPLWLN